VPDFSDAKQLELMWASDPRWAGVRRPYSGEDVVRLRGSVPIDYTIARLGAEKLWKLLSENEPTSRRSAR
jgi:isocitrate lyase